MPNECCPTDRTLVTSDYTAKGTIVELDGMQIYSIGECDRGIVVGYDIFGFYGNIFQFCDKLSEVSGMTVVLPDFFRGDRMKKEDFPPKDRSVIREWIDKVGTQEIVDKSLTTTVFPLLAKRSITKVGFFGLCWGGRVAFGSAGSFSAIAVAHPSALTPELAQNVKCPSCVILTKDEPNLDEVEKVVAQNGHKENSSWERWDDMFHGFCGGRADWTVPEQAKRVTEAIEKFAAFFKTTLNT